MTAVPRQAFTSGQPVARAAVAVNAREIASAPVSSRAAVAPTSNSVSGIACQYGQPRESASGRGGQSCDCGKGESAASAGAFRGPATALAAHPGQPIARQEMQHLQPANNAASAPRPPVKQAPPGKPATATTGEARHSARQGAGQSARKSTGSPRAANERPGANPAQPNRPAPKVNPPAPNNRPEPTPNNRPETNRPNQPVPNNRPAEPPARTDRPPDCATQQSSHAEPAGTRPTRTNIAPAHESSGRAAGAN